MKEPRKVALPDIHSELGRQAFLNQVGSCDSYGDVLPALSEVNRLLHKHGLELVIFDEGSSDYLFDIISKENSHATQIDSHHNLS